MKKYSTVTFKKVDDTKVEIITNITIEYKGYNTYSDNVKIGEYNFISKYGYITLEDNERRNYSKFGSMINILDKNYGIFWSAEEIEECKKAANVILNEKKKEEKILQEIEDNKTTKEIYVEKIEGLKEDIKRYEDMKTWEIATPEDIVRINKEIDRMNQLIEDFTKIIEKENPSINIEVVEFISNYLDKKFNNPKIINTINDLNNISKLEKDIPRLNSEISKYKSLYNISVEKKEIEESNHYNSRIEDIEMEVEKRTNLINKLKELYNKGFNTIEEYLNTPVSKEDTNISKVIEESEIENYIEGEQLQEVKRVLSTLKEKVYNYIIEFNYLNRISFIFDNEILKGDIYIGTNGDYGKNIKLLDHSLVSQLDTYSTIDGTVYINGELPYYKKIEQTKTIYSNNNISVVVKKTKDNILYKEMHITRKKDNKRILSHFKDIDISKMTEELYQILDNMYSFLVTEEIEIINNNFDNVQIVSSVLVPLIGDIKEIEYNKRHNKIEGYTMDNKYFNISYSWFYNSFDSRSIDIKYDYIRYSYNIDSKGIAPKISHTA